jgi:Transposase DDE domain
VEKHLDDAVSRPLAPYLEALTQVRAQDLEPTPQGEFRIAKALLLIARDLTRPVILGCAVTPANRPEEEGAVPIQQDIERQGLFISELHIDRAYVNSPIVDEVWQRGGEVFSKPWAARPRSPGLFSKLDFKRNLHAKTITCPAGEVEPFEPGQTVEFDHEACGACPMRAKCTQAASGRGRTVSISHDEAEQKHFRKLQQTRRGRAILRERTPVEHALAHIAARKGNRARYIGVRRNLFDLRRAAAIQNLEAVHRELAAQANLAA